MAEPQITMEFSTLEGLLRPTISEYLQDGVVSILRRFLGDMKATDSAPGGLAGIQMPEVDGELADVQAEVDEILQRLSKQRTNVPNIMAAAIRQQLQALRPSSSPESPDEQTEAPGTSLPLAVTLAAGGGTGWEEDAGLQEAVRLQQMLGEALNKLPALRAKLEQAEQRLARNLSAVEADKHRPSPKTAERIMINRTNLTARDGSQAGQDAGSGLTKRLLARELAQA